MQQRGEHWHYRYYYGKCMYDYLFKIKFFRCFSFVLATLQSLIPFWTVLWTMSSILAFQLLHSPPWDCQLQFWELWGSFLFPGSDFFDSQGLSPVLSISPLPVGLLSFQGWFCLRSTITGTPLLSPPFYLVSIDLPFQYGLWINFAGF